LQQFPCLQWKLAKQNLQLLSQTVLERIQPAVVFKDKGAIDQILADYTTDHAIRSIHVYDPEHQLLAESTKQIAHTSFLQSILDRWFLHDPIKLIVMHHKKKLVNWFYMVALKTFYIF
jgi:sulfatase maturation enzyme AslB (radical SAM superfamily)